MIDPTQDDIGRAVVYTPRHPGARTEEGLITSFNRHAVFVRYGGDKHSKGTHRSDLAWAHPQGMMAVSEALRTDDEAAP